MEDDEVVSVAWPPLSATVPSVREPSVNVTLPVGVGAPCRADTVAVNVTAWPEPDGFEDDESRVEVAMRRTSWSVASRLGAYVRHPSRSQRQVEAARQRRRRERRDAADDRRRAERRAAVAERDRAGDGCGAERTHRRAERHGLADE